MSGRRTSLVSLRARIASSAIAIAAIVMPARADFSSATRPAKVVAATKPSIVAKPVAAATRLAPKPLTPAAAAKPVPASPASAAELLAVEARVEVVSKAVLPAVVGVTVENGQGSGVIVSPDGYVLTAAHVTGEPNLNIWITLPDGRRVKAKTLGTNKGIDSGLIKIDGPGPWPYCEIGKSGLLAKGQWVLALGHPGGYQRNRPPVVRLGRVLANNGVDGFVMTDCTLVGGDSGGPLFDLDGKVVGIHSRIGPSTLNNMHVPADTYTGTWDRLVKGDAWGDKFAFLRPNGPMLGIGGENLDGEPGARITNVTANGPAADAGIRSGDVVTLFDGKPVTSIEQLAEMISKKKVGDAVPITVTRDGKKVEFDVKLVRRPRTG